MAVDEIARVNVRNLEKNVDDGFSKIDKRLTLMEGKSEQMFNHLSSRLPPWGTALITIMTALLAGFIGLGVGGS